MTIDKIVKNVIVAGGIALSANNANAQEVKAQEATEEQFAEAVKSNDEAINDPYSTISPQNKEDWLRLKNVLNSSQVPILIQADPNYPGYCNVGGDGLIGVYDGKHINKKRTLDGKLEKVEFILNLSESDPHKKYLFPCDLEVEVTPNLAIVHLPGNEVEKEVPNGTFSPGVGYVHIFADPDQNGSIAHLPGAELSFTFQPRSSEWYFGPFATLYGNSNSETIPLSSAATEGPLAGQLVLKGENNYDVTIFGGALGFIVGGDLYHRQNGFGLGLELSAALMPELTITEFTERSAYVVNCRIIEGKEVCDLVEGSNVSNSSDDQEFNLYVSNRAGLRLEWPYFFATPSFGFRTNFDADRPLDAVLGLTVGYNPKQE